jgi:hypothetical protein
MMPLARVVRRRDSLFVAARKNLACPGFAMAPRFKAGDFGGEIERGVEDIITVCRILADDAQLRAVFPLEESVAGKAAIGPAAARAVNPNEATGKAVPSAEAEQEAKEGQPKKDEHVKSKSNPRSEVVERRRSFGQLVMPHLFAEDQRRIGAAIKAAEATTAGEIVCVLARRLLFRPGLQRTCERISGRRTDWTSAA